jgi:hypothetical protein
MAGWPPRALQIRFFGLFCSFLWPNQGPLDCRISAGLKGLTAAAIPGQPVNPGPDLCNEEHLSADERFN